MILALRSPEAANKLIRNWVYIEGKQIEVSKLTSEPRRCLKCQKIEAGHIAVNCPSKQDTCGTCGEAHKTLMCKITDRKSMKCTNCNVTGHPAWDCTCPTFIARAVTHDSKHPENDYKYYPTADPGTWELLGSGDKAGEGADPLL